MKTKAWLIDDKTDGGEPIDVKLTDAGEMLSIEIDLLNITIMLEKSDLDGMMDADDGR